MILPPPTPKSIDDLHTETMCVSVDHLSNGTYNYRFTIRSGGSGQFRILAPQHAFQIGDIVHWHMKPYFREDT